MSSKVLLTPLKTGDIEEILSIEKQLFPTPWAADSFFYELSRNPNGRYYALRIEGKIQGYGGMWLIMDEAHITTMAVAKEVQGLGLGELLFLHLLKVARENRVQGVTLEVRQDNLPACSLYYKYDLSKVGYRPNYYGPGQDALILWLRKLQGEYYRRKLENFERLWKENHDEWEVVFEAAEDNQ